MHAICRHVWMFVEQKCRDHPCGKGHRARSELRYNSSMATLRFHIVPNRKIDKVAGEHDGAIKIKLRAPAVEGKANAALTCFLADQLNISQRAIIVGAALTSWFGLLGGLRLSGCSAVAVK